MYRLQFLMCVILFAGVCSDKPRFEIKFFDGAGKCLDSVNEYGIEKVRWSRQCYTFKSLEELLTKNFYNGRVVFYFDSKELTTIYMFDFLSSRMYPKDTPVIYTMNGRIKSERGEMCVLNAGKSQGLNKLTANKQVFLYLREKHIAVE